MRTSNHALSSKLVGLPRRPTLERYLDFWLGHIAWPQLRFSTARTYAGVVLRLIVPTLGAMRVSKLTTSDLERTQVVWLRAGVTASMRRKGIEVLRSALRHALALGLCKENVAVRATVPRKSKRAPVWLDAPEALRLLRSAEGHSLEASYALVIGLGLRRGEVLGLTWADVDLRRRVIHVRWSRTEFASGTRLTEPKSAASRRTLALPGFVAEALRRQRAREVMKAATAGVKLRPSDPVLTTRTRRPFWTSYVHDELQARLRRLGLAKMRFHDLRHTAASMMLAEGVSPRTVMEVMGHRDLAVTMFVYGHVNLRHQREAATVVDRVLGHSWGPLRRRARSGHTST